MQRYEPRSLSIDGMVESETGRFILLAEAQAEIDALHAECDRLTAMLEKPEVK